MAILWLLSCLVLLSGAYGQKCGVSTKFVKGKSDFSWSKSYWNENLGIFCGADMVSNRMILVAAHCVYKEYKSSLEEWLAIEAGGIENVFIHIGDHDIALIKLSSNATSNERLPPVCLPANSDLLNKGESCVTTQFRNTKDSKATSANNQQVTFQKSTEATPDNPQQVTVPILTDDECQKHWGIKSKRNEICTGLSSCVVDSGATLVCERNGTWTLTGIASSSCSKSKPAMFTHMSIYRGWIDKIIRDK